MIRTTFLETGQVTADLIADRRVAVAWSEPSDLVGYDIDGQVSHPVRSNVFRDPRGQQGLKTVVEKLTGWYKTTRAVGTQRSKDRET